MLLYQPQFNVKQFVLDRLLILQGNSYSYHHIDITVAAVHHFSRNIFFVLKLLTSVNV